MTDTKQQVCSARLDGTGAAAYLGRSRSWLEKQRCHGSGPRFLKVGGRVLYRMTDLDSYLDGCTRETSDSRRAVA